MLIDTHCHLDAAEFDADREAVHAAARAAGVETIVVPAVEVSAFARTRETVSRYPGCVAAYGIHPLYVMQAADDDLAALRQFPVASTPLSDELARLLVEQLGPDAHPARLVTLDSEDITSLLDLVEATDTVFFGIFACARARIAAGRICEIQVQPHVERFGEYALVSLARRSTSPAVEVFRAFFMANLAE